MVECLLTLRRIYEVERNDGKRSPRRPFALSPRSGTPNVSGHPPLRLSQRHSSPFLATPDVNYQAVQQVQSQQCTTLQVPDAILHHIPQYQLTLLFVAHAWATRTATLGTSGYDLVSELLQPVAITEVAARQAFPALSHIQRCAPVLQQDI